MRRTTTTTLLGAMLLATYLPADSLAAPANNRRGSGGRFIFQRFPQKYSSGKG
jgi:hypothetical protein